MSENKEQTIFEKMGGKYINVGDYYVPDFGQFDEDTKPVDDRPLGKYGMLREIYLKERRSPLYNHLLLSGKLHSHLRDVNEEAQNLLDRLITQYKARQGVTEELKSQEQMLWVGKMNNIKAQIEEIIYSEIIYI